MINLKFRLITTVLLNYGIIKVIESYTYKGFEGKSPGESEDTK